MNVKLLLAAASKDPEIKNVSDFRSFVDISEPTLDKPTPPSRPKYNVVNFAVGDAADRRGMKRKIPNADQLVTPRDRLRNNPSESIGREFEVYNYDRIPLYTYRKMAVAPPLFIGPSLAVLDSLHRQRSVSDC